MLSSFFLPALFVFILTSSAAAQESASERVASLRAHVSQVEKAYSNSLISTEQNVSISDRVNLLRQAFRDKSNQLIQKATSSEAVLAMLRAEADTYLDVIRVYETHAGIGQGENTTDWNLFTDQELAEMRGKINARLISLMSDARVPPQDVSLSVEFRKREVEGWLGGLDAEINRRKSLTAPVRLKEIRNGLTVTEAQTKFSEIAARDGNSNHHFRQKLGHQVQLRLHNAPQDAPLRALELEVPKMKLLEMSPSIPRGPPTSVQMAQEQIRTAHNNELQAFTRRDPVALAEARAQLSARSEWWARKYNKSIQTDKLGFSATSTDHLIELRDNWKKAYPQLILEAQADPNNSLPKIRLKEADARIRDITAFIEHKNLPRPPDGNDWGSGSLPTEPPDPPGPGLRALEKGWEREIAHREIVELGRARNQFSSMSNVEIPERIIKASREKIFAEAISLQEAHAKNIKFGHDLLIRGRGAAASEVGQQVQKARLNIQAAASELLDSVSDPRLGDDPTAQQAKEILTKFAQKDNSIQNASYSDALLVNEQAHDSVLQQSTKIEIQEVTRNSTKPGIENHIQIEKKSSPPSPLRNIKPPAEYNELYPKQKRVPTLPEIIKDPRRAPGGIIIDAHLPDELSHRLQALQVDIHSGAIKAKIANDWISVRLPRDLFMSRLAWAFVQDEQSAVIDLRPLEAEEAFWLVMNYGDNQSPDVDPRSLVQNLMTLTSVNVNDALRDTSIVPHLISADQLMFDLLPQKSVRIEEENKWPGLDIEELRRAFRADAGAELRDLRSADILFKKSLLAISNIKYELGAELAIAPQISFHLFGVPYKGDEVRRLNACERWFNANEKTLRESPQLSKLADFAVLVTLFRSVREHPIQHNLDELIAVPVPATTSPRFIVREEHIGAEGWQQLRKSFAVKEK